MTMLGRVVALTMAAWLLTGLTGWSQEKKVDKAAGHQARPGPIHQQLAKRVGEYTTASKFALKPGEPAQETRGTAKITPVLGGRFLQEENFGTMIGQPFTGLRLTGYNTGAEQYEAMWVYSGSTSIMTLSGSSKDGGKTINWTGSFEATKGSSLTLYVTTRYLDDDRFVIELYAKNDDGSRGPAFETTYTRKK